MYYLNYKLYIETAVRISGYVSLRPGNCYFELFFKELQLLSEKSSNCYEFLHYPAQGLVFLAKIDNIEDVVKFVTFFFRIPVYISDYFNLLL